VLALDRANLAFMEGHFEQSLRELASIRVKNHKMVLLEAWSNYRLGRIEEARSGFAKVAAEHPDSADALGGLGYCALRSGDLDVAGRQFNLVLSMHPDDPQTMSGLAHVKYRQGQFSRAKTLFARVLERNPDDSEAREMLNKLKTRP
jgi:Flp pilus assembly protein TadD